MTPHLLTLLYELLDAHDDTTRLASARELDGRWRAHLDYLGDLQRVAREVLAQSVQQPAPQAGQVNAVDVMIDDYVSWREACAEVASSYGRWRLAEGREEVLAFSVYVAALDREEGAAIDYQQAVARVAAVSLRGRGSSRVRPG
jgi:hypothetical protein